MRQMYADALDGGHRQSVLPDRQDSRPDCRAGSYS
jgi:hypothetical protein